jgi:soluble lytic murein transglycosylase-like protein
VGVVIHIVVAAATLAHPAPPARATGDWSSFVDEAAARFAIPREWILATIARESRGRAWRDGRPIRSSKGAMGMMQLMPTTWRAMRYTLGLGPDPDDPHDNILAGSAYLRRLYDRFGYPGLFAAYNAGPARYAAFLDGRPLPRETRAYLVGIDVMPARSRAVTSNAVPVGLLVVRAATPLRDENATCRFCADPADGLFAIRPH